MSKEIRLSSNEFKALASETRAGIIKLLQERNHTLTEISKKLKLAAPTIKQHMGILEGAELIQELDEGRKWKYYSLTRKGKNIFAPETPVNILIVLGTSIIALVGMVNSFLMMMGTQATVMAKDKIAQSPAFIGAEEKIVPAGGNIPEDFVSGSITEIISEGTANASQVNSQIIALVMAIIIIALIAGFFIAKIRE